MTSITLSNYTRALLNNLRKIKAQPALDDDSRISVSQTASFFALAYEKIRNAVEYRENHLIRRLAIARILKRRLMLNSNGQGEAENLIRELLWARYFPNESLGNHHVSKVQEILNKYLTLMRSGLNNDFLFDLLTCEIEEALSPEDAVRNSLETFYVYQVLKNKVKIEGLDEEQKNIYFFVALEKFFAKSDTAYLRFHLFKLFGESPSREIFHKIDTLINNSYSIRFRRFINNQIPPFKILFELVKKGGTTTEEILQSEERLAGVVQQICDIKYTQSAERLRGLAIKAIVYIFLTKMIFALILEYPLSVFLFGEVNYLALGINSLFPPILMFIIVGLTRIPGQQNTKRIYERMIDVIDKDKSYEMAVSVISKRQKVRKPTLIFAFTIIYSLTFIVTFSILFRILKLFQFNLISQLVFVFFVSLVAFFSYRIRNVAKEYQLKERESFIRPFVDFFAIPFLSVGQFLSRGIARLNFFGAALDFLIEAPFKSIIEVLEEWISFIRARKEEII